MPAGAKTPPVKKLKVVLEGLKQEAPGRAEAKPVRRNKAMPAWAFPGTKQVDDL
jgi:hypothetical protein